MQAEHTCPLLAWVQVNQYQPRAGQTTCIQCPAGTSTQDTGNFECTPCPLGYYSPRAGAPLPLGAACLQQPQPHPCSRCLPHHAAGPEPPPNPHSPATCPGCSHGVRGGSTWHLREPYRSHLCSALVSSVKLLTGPGDCCPCQPAPPPPCLPLICLPAHCPQCSPKGTYSSVTGADECEPCAPGQYANVAGSLQCRVSAAAGMPWECIGS